MKRLTTLLLSLMLFISVQPAFAVPSKHDKAVEKFKNYINTLVRKVENAQSARQKRAILNNTFDDMLLVFNKVEKIGVVSGRDQKALTTLEKNIQSKQNELNGKNGYQRVPDNELNHFAHYVQQDLEQADTITITISATVLVLIVIILILV